MKLRSIVRLGLLVAISLLASGCFLKGAIDKMDWIQPRKVIRGVVPVPAKLQPGGGFEVGAARVDLTPIPGIAMSYSLEGKLSRGFWTRLYARSIYMHDDAGNSLVFVSCELAAIPNGLRDRVAQKLGESANAKHLGRSQIVLAATHTHNGPQNYFSSPYYNKMPGARAGFDPQLFDFLATRIAQSIENAVANKKPVTHLRYKRAQLANMFRNRSLEVFRLNPEAQALIDENAQVPGTCNRLRERPDDGPDVCKAVRTWVEVLEFHNGNERVASQVFLAAHPTVLDIQTEVYNGDVFGMAASMVERGSIAGCASYETEVLALFNGAEGDASLTWTEAGRDRTEVEKHAEALANFICGATTGFNLEVQEYPEQPAPLVSQVQSQPQARPPIPAQALRHEFAWPVELAGQSDGTLPHDCDPWHERCTANTPRAGLASMGGAQDGRTVWYELGVHEELRAAQRNKHGRKVLGIEGVNISDLVKVDGKLGQVAVGVYRVGPFTFATLPGEFTTMMGRRIRKAVEQALPPLPVASPPQQRVLLVGLANGRVSYVTTPEEFDAQFYEGAQNLFGAATGPVVQASLVELARRMGQSTNSTPSDEEHEHFRYSPGACRVFLPKDVGAPPYWSDDGLANLLGYPEASASPSVPSAIPPRTMKQRCWVDAIPKLSKIPPFGDECARAVPYVWIEPVAAVASQQCAGMFPANPSHEFYARPCDVPHPDECDASLDPRYCRDRVPQDNCGGDVLTVLHGTYEDRTRWCAFWLDEPQNANFEICVAGVTNRNIAQTRKALLPLRPPHRADARMPELDLGETKWIERVRECAGCSTRTVCEFPEDLLTP